MDYNALRQGIHEEATNGTLEILSESGTDILVFDYNDSKEINFHMIPPTREWLASRIVWGPSLTCDAIPAWTAYLADYLYRVDPNMFVCLNRIIVIDDSADRKAIATLLGVDEDNLPEENEDLIGQLWLQENCVFLNANYPAKKGTRNFSVSLPGGVASQLFAASSMLWMVTGFLRSITSALTAATQKSPMMLRSKVQSPMSKTPSNIGATFLMAAMRQRAVVAEMAALCARRRRRSSSITASR